MSGEADKLFDKKYTCPVCENNFTSKTVRSGKARMVRTDMDLRNVYDGIEPLKYDVILCPKCGYAALSRFFPNVSNISSNNLIVGDNTIKIYAKTKITNPSQIIEDEYVNFGLKIEKAVEPKVTKVNYKFNNKVTTGTTWTTSKVVEVETNISSDMIKSIQYSFDKKTWEDFTNGIELRNPSQKIYFKVVHFTPNSS